MIVMKLMIEQYFKVYGLIKIVVNKKNINLIQVK